MASFKWQYTKCVLDYIPNDVSIQIESYLTDATGLVFVNTGTLGIDTFTVQAYKNSLPASGYDSYLSIITNKFIGEKYNLTLGGYGVKDSSIITQISDTSKIVPGVYVYGTGIQADSTIVSVRDKNSIELNKPVTVTGSVSLSLTTTGWVIDFSQISHLTQVIDFANL